MNAPTMTPKRACCSRRSPMSLLAKLLLDNWSPGPPAHVNAATVEIDRQAARDCCCELCGHRGLVLQPLHSGRQYMALAACPACGNQEEV